MNVWRNLVSDLMAEGVFMSQRIKPELLKERYDIEKASMALDTDGRIIGYCALWPTIYPEIVELGTLWVHKQYRGRRYGEKNISETIVADCTSKLKKAGLRGIMIVGINRAVKLAIDCGWEVDGTGNCQAIRWALTGEDRPRSSAGSARTPIRTILVYYPQ